MYNHIYKHIKEHPEMRIRSLLSVLALSLLAIPATAHAQGTREGRGVDLGPQILYGGDTDLGVGGRLIVNLESLPNWDFLASFNVWFPDDGGGVDRSAWEANANLAYNFLIEDVESIFPYVGAGLNLFHFSADFPNPENDFDNTDLGINLFGGTKFTAGSLTPFVEVRVVLEGADQVVLAFGLLF